MSAWRLLPRPEMSTATRRAGSDPTIDAPVPARGLTPDATVLIRGKVGKPIATAVFIMARPRRFTPGGYVYHVCNRGSRKGVVLETYEDYAAFCELTDEARRKNPMRIVAYCLRQTHFHFLLWPVADNDLPRFMKWLTQTHAQRFHRHRGSVGTGAVYQSRYFARGLWEPQQFFTALCYVEANARKDGLVSRAEDWPWCSASKASGEIPTVAIDDSPIARPANWLEILNHY